MDNIDNVVVKQVVIDIACSADVDVAEQVQIALVNSPVFTRYKYYQGGCYIIGDPSCEASWSVEEYQASTGRDALEVE